MISSETEGGLVSRRIYLDYNASTPICPEAVEAMRPFLFEHYGNPSSLHWAGMPAKDAVEKARGQVASLLGCDPTEVVFTSGGSESNNHAIKGVFFANRDRGDHIITTAVEHPAALNPCRFLERLGALDGLRSTGNASDSICDGFPYFTGIRVSVSTRRSIAFGTLGTNSPSSGEWTFCNVGPMEIMSRFGYFP